MASRVQADVWELWGESGSGKARGTDLLNKRKSLPIVYALEHGPISLRRALGTLYFKRVLVGEDLVQMTDLLDTIGARAYADATVERLLNQALRRLEELALSSAARAELERVARFLAFREP